MYNLDILYMNSAGLKGLGLFLSFEGTQLPLYDMNPTLHAHLYPVQYVFGIDEQSFTTYSFFGLGDKFSFFPAFDVYGGGVGNVDFCFGGFSLIWLVGGEGI